MFLYVNYCLCRVCHVTYLKRSVSPAYIIWTEHKTTNNGGIAIHSSISLVENPVEERADCRIVKINGQTAIGARAYRGWPRRWRHVPFRRPAASASCGCFVVNKTMASEEDGVNEECEKILFVIR